MALHEKAIALLESGAVRTVIGQELEFNALPDAFKTIEDRSSVGRSIVIL